MITCGHCKHRLYPDTDGLLRHKCKENRMTYNYNKEQMAALYAMAAHTAAGNIRKHTGQPYIVHPQAVVQILIEANSNVTTEQIQAAWLHDVLEDTKVSNNDILHIFGITVTNYVMQLTNDKEGKRKERKEREVKMMQYMNPLVQDIRLADSIHNMTCFLKEDIDHCELYFTEKRHLITAMSHGHPKLLKQFWELIDEYDCIKEKQSTKT